MPNGGAVGNSDAWPRLKHGVTNRSERCAKTPNGTRVACSASSRKWLANICVKARRSTSRAVAHPQLAGRIGVTRYVTEVLVGQNGTMQMLGGRRGGQPESAAPQQPAQPQSPAARHNLLAPLKPKAGGKGRQSAAPSQHLLSRSRTITR
jgi:single-strand DNA-binding protein